LLDEGIEEKLGIARANCLNCIQRESSGKDCQALE
jgi:hypothetical protein